MSAPSLLLPPPLQLGLGVLSQPLSGCIKLLLPGALDPVRDPHALTHSPLHPFSLRFKLPASCPPRSSRSRPPASRPLGRGRGQWRHGSSQWTQLSHYERRLHLGGQGSGVKPHPPSLQTLRLAWTLQTGESRLMFSETWRFIFQRS